MSKLIRAILFDLVGVLLVPDAEVRSDDVLQLFDRMIGQCADDAQLRTHAMEQFHLDEEEFGRLLVRVAHQYNPFHPLWEILPVLKNRYSLGIINNGTYLTFPTFQDCFHLDEFFDVILCSGREGIRKPDERIYSLAVDRLGVLANECLFMDDALENVAGAEAAGMKALHWPDIQTGYSNFHTWLNSEEVWIR